MASESSAKRPPPDMSSPVEGSLEGLIGSDDYPAEALNRNEEGTVQFRISIDETGAVRDCVIEKSSGSAALDAQTCRLMWLRAKFKPARDKDGKPVADQKTAKIAWRIAELERPSEAWAMRSVLVLVAGSDPVCRVDAEGAMASHMVTEGPCPADALELSAELPSVPNARTEFIEEQRFAVGAEPHLAMVDGDRLVGSQLVQIEVRS